MKFRLAPDHRRVSSPGASNSSPREEFSCRLARVRQAPSPLFTLALRHLAVLAFLCCHLPAWALDASELGLIINSADPLSVRIGGYYAEKRRIPFQNVVEVAFPPGRPVMTLPEFQALKLHIDIHLPKRVQALALTWAAPYRVECMSITSALAFGFDLGFCTSGCQATRPSPYFNSPARRPYAQHGVRIAMVIAARSFEQAKALIDRGLRSDGTRPAGTAYLLATSDRARNVRSSTFGQLRRALEGRLRVEALHEDAIRDKNDVLFYITGRERVEDLDTLKFVPGAIADHLTSFGGMLTDSPQMSALAWLEAGATGSYGTVAEPCNIPQKFPNPTVLITSYLRGDSLIEAYWKSVAMPGQGVFVGEPLAKPFARAQAHRRSVLELDAGRQGG